MPRHRRHRRCARGRQRASSASGGGRRARRSRAPEAVDLLLEEPFPPSSDVRAARSPGCASTAPEIGARAAGVASRRVGGGSRPSRDRARTPALRGRHRGASTEPARPRPSGETPRYRALDYARTPEVRRRCWRCFEMPIGAFAPMPVSNSPSMRTRRRRVTCPCCSAIRSASPT